MQPQPRHSASLTLTYDIEPQVGCFGVLWALKLFFAQFTTMSFGYAVGDVIAILNLFERVAVEVRNYRNAPQHFPQASLVASYQERC